MNNSLSLFLLLLTALPKFGHAGDPPRKLRQTDKELVQQFRESRKHKAAAAAAAFNREDPENDGNLRKQPSPDGSNAAASRLTLSEKEKIIHDMRSRLEKDARGEIRLRSRDKERYEQFISRYEEEQSKHSGIGGAQQPSMLALQSAFGGNDPDHLAKLAWYKKNKHKEEFKETRGLILGKTQDERETVADHIREELRNHENRVKTMDEKLYEMKKNALERYDKLNHPEMVTSKNNERGMEKSDDSKDDAGSDDNVASADEEAVSDGKTAEAIEVETLEAPPRNEASSNDEDEALPLSGVVIHREEVKRRNQDEAPMTKEEKEKRRTGQAKVNTSKILHDDGGEEGS